MGSFRPGHDAVSPCRPREVWVSLGRMAGAADNLMTQRLRELAAQEAAAKERLALRTSVARFFSAAVTQLAEAKAAWEGAPTEAERVKAKAVGELLATGLEAGEVAALLGTSERDLRTLRTAAPKTLARAKDAKGEARTPRAEATRLAS